VVVTGAAAAASAAAFWLYCRVEWPWFVLGWVGFVPWLMALDRGRSWGGALVGGLLMCAAFTLAVFSWFATAIQTYTDVSWGVALLVLLLLAPLMQPQFVTYALAHHVAARGPVPRAWWWRALVGACVYVGTEWVAPKLFADTIGHGFYASVSMRQAADLVGAHGLTFVLIVANECALAVVQAFAAGAPRRAWAPAACVAATVLALLTYGTVRRAQLRAVGADGTLTAAVVQADISQYQRLAAEMGTYQAVRMILDAHFALSQEALRRAHPDVVVWPETVYPTTFGAPKSAQGAAFDREIGGFVATTGVPLIFGAYDVEADREFNAAVLLEPSSNGPTFETYRKASLFPLTERVPALLDVPLVRRWWPWLGTWRPGTGPQVLSLALPGGRTIRIAPLICYDAVDPQRALAAVRAGAEVIVTLSNDSWFAAGAGPHLHLVVSAFRSLETRRPQIRATNTGISAVITPTGELLDVADVHQRTVLTGVVRPERRATTVLLVWGDWFGPTALACGVGLLTAALVRPGARR